MTPEEIQNPFKAQSWCCLYCGTPDPDEAMWMFFKAEPEHEKHSMAALFWMCGSCKNTRYHDDEKPWEAFCKIFDGNRV